MNNSLGYVYFVVSDSQKSKNPNNTLVKIGFTTRELNKRLTELNTGNPSILRYCHYIICEKYPADKIEKYIHNLAKNYKLKSSPNSEWYDTPSEFLNWMTSFSNDLELLTS